MHRFDVLVVGGGTAGCVLAARLSEESSRTVCLLEAGPDYGAYEDGGWPAELLSARVMPTSHDWGVGGEDERSLGARVIGGCSAHNACMIVRGTPADYDEWGGPWAYDRFAPYLDRAEAALSTVPANTAQPSPLHRAFAEAARTAGFAQVGDAESLAPVSCGPFPANVRGDVRWNAAFAYLDAARARPNLRVRGGTLVDRVLLRDGQATGVLTHEGEEIAAGLVVVACGAYLTPALLMRSGIGPEDELRPLGIEPLLDLPVGENLLDHYGTGLGWEPSQRLHAATAEHELDGRLFEAHIMLRAASAACPHASFDLHLLPWMSETGTPGRYLATTGVFLVKPRSSGRVRLTASDPAVLPLVERGFLATDGDLQPIVEGIELGRELAATEPLDRLLATELRPGPTRIEAYVRETARNYFHPAGTCAIGAVVDHDCRVLGTAGLVVADASVMPTIPRANTNLTTAAIAERVAETL